MPKNYMLSVYDGSYEEYDYRANQQPDEDKEESEGKDKSCSIF